MNANQMEVIRRQLTQLADAEKLSDLEVQQRIGACVIALNTLAIEQGYTIKKAVSAEASRHERPLRQPQWDYAIATLREFGV